MKIVIHIGVHKTGTTALQLFLYRNADRLSEHGFLYKPDPTILHNHHCLAIELKRGTAGAGPQLLGELLNSRGSHHTIIVSSEMLCEPGVDIDLLLSFLSGHELDVIAYIRHPCDIVISAFNELVRDPGTKWTHPINEAPFAYPPDQLISLKPWIGRANLVLAPYDRKQWIGGSLFSDFLNMIGAPIGEFDFSPSHENVSLPHPLAETLRLFNLLNPSEEQHQVMVRHLRTIQCGLFNYPLLPQTVAVFQRMMEATISVYRPHFRKGFREDFLFEPRPTGEGRQESPRSRELGGSPSDAIKT